MTLSYDFHVHTYLNGHSDPAQDVPTILAPRTRLASRRLRSPNTSSSRRISRGSARSPGALRGILRPAG